MDALGKLVARLHKLDTQVKAWEASTQILNEKCLRFSTTKKHHFWQMAFSWEWWILMMVLVVTVTGMIVVMVVLMVVARLLARLLWEWGACWKRICRCQLNITDKVTDRSTDIEDRQHAVWQTNRSNSIRMHIITIYIITMGSTDWSISTFGFLQDCRVTKEDVEEIWQVFFWVSVFVYLVYLEFFQCTLKVV